MPVNMPTPYNLVQFEFDGISASFNFIDINENKNTPICFPKNKPHKIPRGTGSNIVFIEMLFNDTPAFANAKRGIIPKAT